jgi:hypothetical protein
MLPWAPFYENSVHLRRLQGRRGYVIEEMKIRLHELPLFLKVM